MRYFFACLLMSIPFAAQAAFVEVNVDPAVTSCGVLLDTTPKVVIAATAPTPPATQKKCRYDVSTVAVGVHDVKLTAIVDHPVWGVLESAQSAPFAFARPALPAVPASPALVP